MSEPATPIGGSFHRLIRNMRKQAEKDARAEHLRNEAREALEQIVGWLSPPSGPDEAKCALARATDALLKLSATTDGDKG